MTPGPSRREWAVLGAILLVGALLRFPHAGADLPLELERTNAPVCDAYWYLEAAAGAAEGSPPDADSRYDVPVWTSLGRVWFALVGTSLGTAAALGSLVALVTIALLWRILRAGCGPLAAHVGAATLAVLYPFVGLSRTTLIYGPAALALTVAAAVWLRGRTQRGWVRVGHEAAAWAIVLATTAAIRPPAIALAGGLAAGHAARSRRLRPWVLGAAALGLLALVVVATSPPAGEALIGALQAGGGLLAAEGERLQRYLAGQPTLGDLVVRLLGWGVAPGGVLGGRELRFAWGSGFVGLAPWTLAVAAVGACSWRSLARRSPAGRETAAVLLGWGATFLLGAALITYRPQRYFVILCPPIAAAVALAVDGLVRAARSPAPSSSRQGLDLLALAGACLGGSTVWVHAVDALFRPTRIRLLSAGVEGALLGALLYAGWRWGRPRLTPRLQRGLAAALAVAALVPTGATSVLRLHASPSWTTRDGSAALAALVGPDAKLVGPYAPVLSIGTGRARLRGGQLDFGADALPNTIAELRRIGATHVALDTHHAQGTDFAGQFLRAGSPLAEVARLELKRPAAAGPPGGAIVLVYRFPWASGQR